MVSSGISDVVSASVHTEKTRLKKLMMMMKMMMMIIIIIIMNKLQFLQAPEIGFRYETEARKVMVYFKFDALYRVTHFGKMYLNVQIIFSYKSLAVPLTFRMAHHSTLHSSVFSTI